MFSFVEDSDFFEGVRAKLIEKDNKPEWKYKSIKDVNMVEVNKRFFDRSEEIDVNPEEETTENVENNNEKK